MYNSLLQHCGEFHLFFLCLDAQSVKRLDSMSLGNVTVIPLETFEAGDTELVETKTNRTTLEYYYTCSPSLPLYILKTYPEIHLITYLDSDLYFYSDPQPLIDELDGYSVGITWHNFPEYKSTQRTGKYNVGWLTFRRDVNGLACLRWWRERCIEWCYARHEDGKYADQLYLDQWPELFAGIRILHHRGANVAEWNVADYTIYEDNGKVMVSGYPLVFYHFAGFKQVSRYVFNPSLHLNMGFTPRALREKVYKPYIAELLRDGYVNDATPSLRQNKLSRAETLRSFARTLLGIALGQYVVVTKRLSKTPPFIEK